MVTHRQRSTGPILAGQECRRPTSARFQQRAGFLHQQYNQTGQEVGPRSLQFCFAADVDFSPTIHPSTATE